jgi:hypothetical protein
VIKLTYSLASPPDQPSGVSAMRLAKFISLFRNGSVQPHEKTTRDHRVRLRLEELERREVPALNPTGFEQEMLELMNRMRI